MPFVKAISLIEILFYKYYLTSWLINNFGWDFPVAQLVKNLSAMQETLVQFLGREDSLEKG